jgi:hypothetical protein
MVKGDSKNQAIPTELESVLFAVTGRCITATPMNQNQHHQPRRIVGAPTFPLTQTVPKFRVKDLHFRPQVYETCELLLLQPGITALGRVGIEPKTLTL